MFSNQWTTAKAQGEFQIAASAPANIAFVKYWGKKGDQLPINPSISMTLSESRTLTELEATASNKLSLELWFEGNRSEAFEAKTLKYLEKMAQTIPAIGGFKYKITSQNTFPHSSGIASSASSQAALAVVLGKLLSNLTDTKIDLKSVGSMARLGSGSACRSIKGGYMMWGQTELLAGSSDEFATDVTGHVHADFLNARDSILVVSSKSKDVSSTQGHAKLNSHPFTEARIKQANSNMADLWNGMKSGDWEKVGDVIETEALTLHALMFTSNPGIVLLEPNSLEVIRLVRLFRRESGVPLYFTIDAGPNIHLIYPDSAHAKVEPFVRHELMRLTENGNSVIWDQMGVGASL